MKSLYEYGIAEVVNVIDGDTYDLKVDAGFHLIYANRFRLGGFDTPELRRGSLHEREQGQAARVAATDWLSAHADHDLRINSHKADSFGRWLAAVFCSACFDADPVEATLGLHLEGMGLATRWPTRWREVYDS